PQFAAVFVTNVKHLARPIADRVIGPWADLVLLAVDAPRVATALDRHLETERGVGDDVDPWCRCPLSLAEDGHIFRAVSSETAQAVEKLELRHRHNGLRYCEHRALSVRRREGRGGFFQPFDLLEKTAAAIPDDCSRRRL